MKATKSAQRYKMFQKLTKKRARNHKIQESRKLSKLEEAHKLEKGKLYFFVGTNDACIYAEPDWNSRVIEHVGRKGMVMFVETMLVHQEDQQIEMKSRSLGWSSDIAFRQGGLFAMVKVGHKDVFGWMACHVDGKEFMSHKFFRRLNP
jgi:hypothetical protein